MNTQGAAITPEAEFRRELGQLLPRLWRYGLVLSRQKHLAEDLVQATCVRALERAGQFAAGTRLDRWLLAIMHSIWLNEVRAQRVRQGQGFVDAEQELSFDGESLAQEQVLAAQVIKRVNGLPEAQRETVFLAYVEGLSYKEIAEVLHIPVGTVMSRLAAARAKLAETAPSQAQPDKTRGERR
ncbi:RNA polymerase sigma factor [Pseudomonas sp. P7548]|nr:RNA polymerase sigma-70 factor (ECF subfamily) [Pseudomonas sp. BIGb0164]NWE23719.1 RNA polymerase sigma factor [Pseudomonas sp. P7548]